MTTTTRTDGLLEEYETAPQLFLVFPASRQMWKLRLTAPFAQQLATEVRRSARVDRGPRRTRRRVARNSSLRPALIRR